MATNIQNIKLGVFAKRFWPDEESSNEQGMYTHCLVCGAGENFSLLESLKEVS